MSDLLHISDLAWEGIEDAAPTSLSDMLVEISNNAHNSDRLPGALKILGLESSVKIVLEDSSAAALKSVYSVIQRSFQAFFDTYYHGFEGRAFIDCIRVGTSMYIYVGTDNEENLLKSATPRYLRYVKEGHQRGWARGGVAHGNELFDEDEKE